MADESVSPEQPEQPEADRGDAPESQPEAALLATDSSQPSGPSRTGLIAIGGAVLVVLLLAAVLLTRRGDEPQVTATPTSRAPATTVDNLPTTGTAATDNAPATTDPFAAAPVETFAPAVTAPPNTHVLPPEPFQVVQPKAQGNLAIYPNPGATVPSQTLPNPILIDNDPNAAVPLAMLLRGSAGGGWLEVFLPVRPNGSTGFVKTDDVMLTPHNFRIEVHLSQFSLKVFQGPNLILDARVGVATNNTPTPGGLYYTNMLLQPPDPNKGYGTYAYGLSGFSNVLKSFNGGPGQLGIHGGGDNATIGRAVSHGCIRMLNEDIEKLVPILPLGVPVQIFA